MKHLEWCLVVRALKMLAAVVIIAFIIILTLKLVVALGLSLLSSFGTSSNIGKYL